MDQTQLWKTQNLCYAVNQGMRKESHHNINHARDFARTAKFLGKMERLSDYDIFIAVTIGLIHDYDKDEYESIRLTVPMMRDVGYTEQEIADASKGTVATIVGKEPANLLEAVIQDADRANMGDFDFLVTGDGLKEEKCYPCGCIKRNKWIGYQLSILKQVKYRTKTAQEIFGPGLRYNIELLEDMLK